MMRFLQGILMKGTIHHDDFVCRPNGFLESITVHLMENDNLHLNTMKLKKIEKKTIKIYTAIIGTSMAQYDLFIRFTHFDAVR